MTQKNKTLVQKNKPTSKGYSWKLPVMFPKNSELVGHLKQLDTFFLTVHYVVKSIISAELKWALNSVFSWYLEYIYEVRFFA